jgi:hypothetical protein
MWKKACCLVKIVTMVVHIGSLEVRYGRMCTSSLTMGNIAVEYGDHPETGYISGCVTLLGPVPDNYIYRGSFHRTIG